MTTVTSLLFGEPPQRGPALHEAFGRIDNPLSNVHVAGVSLPDVDFTNAIADLLDLPVGNLALHGWQQHRRIADAMERTRADGTAREIVKLLEHKVHSSQKPGIDIEIDGVAKRILDLALDVEIQFASVELVIERGTIALVRPGAATARASLSASGITLAERSLTPVDATPSISAVSESPTGA